MFYFLFNVTFQVVCGYFSIIANKIILFFFIFTDIATKMALLTNVLHLLGLILLGFNLTHIDAKYINGSLNSNNLGITPLSNCKVKLDDGSVIDLSSLDNPNQPL